MDPKKVSPPDLPDIPVLKQPKGALDHVEFGECPAEAGEQVVEATVTNKGKAATDYAVTVSWINDTSDVLARAVRVVKAIKPGSSRDIELSAQVPDEATQCAYYVQSGRAGR